MRARTSILALILASYACSNTHSPPACSYTGPDPTAHPATCDSASLAGCAEWAQRSLPGWDVAVLCLGAGFGCTRGDACDETIRVDASGADAGPFAVYCTCGDGPACGPGFQCARPVGDTSPFACVCINPG